MSRPVLHKAKIKNPGKAQKHGKSPEYYMLGDRKVAKPDPYTKKNRGFNVEVSK